MKNLAYSKINEIISLNIKIHRDDIPIAKWF